MMPPPLRLCNGLASQSHAHAASCMYTEICEVIRYVAAPVVGYVDSNFLT